MRPIHGRLVTTALLIVFSALTDSTAKAQDTPATLDGVLTPGTTVWITDSSGREERSRIVGVAGGIVTVAAGSDVRRLRTTEIQRVRVRESDSVINGALIGAGAAVASTLFLCTRMETWENCRDDVGPMSWIGAIGAGVGIGIDALIRGRKTIYESPEGSAQLRAAPIVGRRAGGLRFSFAF